MTKYADRIIHNLESRANILKAIEYILNYDKYYRNRKPITDDLATTEYNFIICGQKVAVLQLIKEFQGKKEYSLNVVINDEPVYINELIPLKEYLVSLRKSQGINNKDT